MSAQLEATIRTHRALKTAEATAERIETLLNDQVVKIPQSEMAEYVRRTS